MEINFEEWKKKARELFGDDPSEWKFKCMFCKRVQSINSILKEQENGTESMRFGKLSDKKKKEINPHMCCYSPKCNCVSNGLFTPETLLIFDIEKPHNGSLKENCSYAFDFASEKVKK